MQRGKLQLVGVTALMIAAKYEEIYPPTVNDFVYITDNTYNQEQARSEARWVSTSHATAGVADGEAHLKGPQL